MIRAFRAFDQRKPRPQTRAEVNDIQWPRQELLQIADLLSHLDVRDVETFCLQRACLARELRLRRFSRLSRQSGHGQAVQTDSRTPFRRPQNPAVIEA